MAKYKVECGSYGRDGQVFKRGDIVTCDENLVKTFPNSFSKVVADGDHEEPASVVEPADDFELDKGPDAVLKDKGTSGRETPDASDDDTEPKKDKKVSKGKGSQASRKGKGKATKDERGKDVTARFPHAKDEDFLVFRKGRGFYVHDTDNPEKALNTKPLQKAEVNNFIDQSLEI